MTYNYPAILKHDILSFEKASLSFGDSREYVLGVLSEIEKKQEEVQVLFDIFNPNISFYIGEYPFNKETFTLDVNTEMAIHGNNLYFNLGINDDSIPNFGDSSVVPVDFVINSTEYLNFHFLNKDTFTNEVIWLYDISSPELTFDADHVFSDDDILPYTYASRLFYKKVDEYFDKLIVLSHDTTSDSSVITKDVSLREFNYRGDATVECYPSRIIGDSVQIYDSSVYISSDVQIVILSSIFKNGYIFEFDSPMDFDFATNEFMLKDLSNADRFVVPEVVIDVLEDTDIITVSNFSDIKSDILEIETTEVGDQFTVYRSGGANALTFRALHSMLLDKLGQFYAVQLKLFLSGYEGNGALGELIRYIEDKIAELKEKFVVNDECDLRALNNIDEGCNIDCGRITLDEPNLIVTKQKLKSIVRCSLTCEGVL